MAGTRLPDTPVMKAGSIIRTFVTIGAACFVIWRITPLIERLDTMSQGLDVASLLSQGQAALPPEEESDELVVYSPEGESLTEAERQRLLAAAARMRPRIREKPTRVSLPGDHAVETAVAPTSTPDSVDIDSLVTPEMVQVLLEQVQNQR